MTFAGQKPRCGIKTDPARARNVGLSPGVKIGDITLRTGRTVKRLYVGGELNQVTGNEARSEPEVPQDLHHQPAAVAARAAAGLQRLLAGLHAGLHAYEILDIALQLPVDRDQKVDGGAA